jgi:hypothetical protein
MGAARVLQNPENHLECLRSRIDGPENILRRHFAVGIKPSLISLFPFTMSAVLLHDLNNHEEVSDDRAVRQSTDGTLHVCSRGSTLPKELWNQ